MFRVPQVNREQVIRDHIEKEKKIMQNRPIRFDGVGKELLDLRQGYYAKKQSWPTVFTTMRALNCQPVISRRIDGQGVPQLMVLNKRLHAKQNDANDGPQNTDKNGKVECLTAGPQVQPPDAKKKTY